MLIGLRPWERTIQTVSLEPPLPVLKDQIMSLCYNDTGRTATLTWTEGPKYVCFLKEVNSTPLALGSVIPRPRSSTMNSCGFVARVHAHRSHAKYLFGAPFERTNNVYVRFQEMIPEIVAPHSGKISSITCIFKPQTDQQKKVDDRFFVKVYEYLGDGRITLRARQLVEGFNPTIIGMQTVPIEPNIPLKRGQLVGFAYEGSGSGFLDWVDGPKFGCYWENTRALQIGQSQPLKTRVTMNSCGFVFGVVP